ncbi:unnamed protein product [Notodromas monacha]|uniref:Uncharacterized protein n=1 Tax=Notodromas monacha TaxID=399045 RepID=A0A7R9GLU4_9CRUS|nr:unnamed protein product [Notodromas monacha]CAG0926037.1 unnamed protein product [Notodromas monacha]
MQGMPFGSGCMASGSMWKLLRMEPVS